MALHFLQGRLSRRITLWVVFASSIFALLATVIQLYREFQNDKSRIHQSLRYIETSSLRPLSASLFQLDTSMARLQLANLRQLPGIICLSVASRDSTLNMEVGDCVDPSPQLLEYSLTHIRGSEHFDLGRLSIHLNYDEVYQNLFKRAAIVLGINGLKTLFSTLAILWVLHQILIRHLHALRSQLNQTDTPIHQATPIALKRSPQLIPDELDAVVDSLNERQTLIHSLFSEQKATYEELAKRSEDQRELLHLLSHDLRTPVVNLSGFTQEIALECQALIDTEKSQSRDPETCLRSLQEILSFARIANSSATLLGNQIKVITDYLRLNRIEIPIVTLNLDELLAEVKLTIAKLIESSGTTIESTPLPSCKGNPEWLGRVIQNLLENAIHYTKPGQAPRISIRGVCEAGITRLEIQDFGVGIPYQEIPQVFRLFYRGNIGSYKEGQGIGIPLSCKALERMQGTLTYKSVAGEWTQAIIELPEG